MGIRSCRLAPTHERLWLWVPASAGTTRREGIRGRIDLAATAMNHVDSSPLLIRLVPLINQVRNRRLWSRRKLDLVLPWALQREMLR